MSGSDRGKGTQVVDWVFPLVGVLIGFWIAWGIGYLGGQEREKRANAAYTYQQKAKERAQRECVGAEPSRVFECVAEKYEAADETQRGEQDLIAQQEAAWGNMFSALWGLLGLFATILGLFWIKGTLDATRDAVSEAAKATEASQRSAKAAELALEGADRPHLLLEMAQLTGLDELPVTDALPFAYQFTNYGKGPAWLRRSAFVFLTTPKHERFRISPDSLPYQENLWNIVPQGAWHSLEGMTVDIAPEKRPEILSGQSTLYLIAAVDYVDADKRQHHNRFVMSYQVERKRFIPCQHDFWSYT